MARYQAAAHAERGAEARVASRHPCASDTESRILTAFLRLAAERGLDRVTTRALARGAGCNEVTIFRRFGDKATLIREAVRRYSPVDRLSGLDPGVDRTDPGPGLRACLRMLANTIRAHPELLRFGLAEAARTAEFPAIMAIPRAVHAFLMRALLQAQPGLRPGVDPEVTALQWMGLLVLSHLLADAGQPVDASPEATERRIAAAVRLVLRNPDDARGDR